MNKKKLYKRVSSWSIILIKCCFTSSNRIGCYFTVSFRNTMDRIKEIIWIWWCFSAMLDIYRCICIHGCIVCLIYFAKYCYNMQFMRKILFTNTVDGLLCFVTKYTRREQFNPQFTYPPPLPSRLVSFFLSFFLFSPLRLHGDGCVRFCYNTFYRK